MKILPIIPSLLSLLKIFGYGGHISLSYAPPNMKNVIISAIDIDLAKNEHEFTHFTMFEGVFLKGRNSSYARIIGLSIMGVTRLTPFWKICKN